MSKPILSRFSIFTLALIATIPPVWSQSNGDFGDPRLTEPDWLEDYYKNPTPDRFVSQMQEYSKDGTLTNESARGALVGFISQLIRQNRDKIEDWYSELSGLAPEEKQILHTAMLYSNAAEAEAILKREFGDKFNQEKEELPKILELKLDEIQTLDMLWGFYYATGSENAIRRIIACFGFADQDKHPNADQVPEGFRPLSQNLPDAAAWTLNSNAIRHPKVKEICVKLYKDEKALSPTERKFLFKEVLSKLYPNEFPEAG